MQTNMLPYIWILCMTVTSKVSKKSPLLETASTNRQINGWSTELYSGKYVNLAIWSHWLLEVRTKLSPFFEYQHHSVWLHWTPKIRLLTTLSLPRQLPLYFLPPSICQSTLSPSRLRSPTTSSSSLLYALCARVQNHTNGSDWTRTQRNIYVTCNIKSLHDETRRPQESHGSLWPGLWIEVSHVNEAFFDNDRFWSGQTTWY